MFILWLLVMSSLQNAFFYSPQVDPSLILITELTATCEQYLYLKFSHTRRGGKVGGDLEEEEERNVLGRRRQRGVGGRERWREGEMEGGREGGMEGGREGGKARRWEEGW